MRHQDGFFFSNLMLFVMKNEYMYSCIDEWFHGRFIYGTIFMHEKTDIFKPQRALKGDIRA